MASISATEPQALHLMSTHEMAPSQQSWQHNNDDLSEASAAWQDVLSSRSPIQSLVRAGRGSRNQDDKHGAERQQQKQEYDEQLKRVIEEKDKMISEEKERKEHEGKTKRGDHWYKEDEKETWADTFKEEEYDIEEKFQSFEEWLHEVKDYLSDVGSIIVLMGKGFMDSGKSFDEAFELLDQDYHQTEWLSEETLQMIMDERDTYMVYSDFSAEGPSIFWDWYKGRLEHLKEVEPVPLVENLVLFVLVTVLTAPGTFSIFSPIFTGWSPTVLALNCVGAQFIANLWINRSFAGGNVYLIAMQAFTVLQWVFMEFLVWNVDIYMYDLRIVRYISELGALVFVVGFVMYTGVEIDLVYVRGALSRQQAPNVFDVFSALFIGYNLALHVPTFLVNAIILLKEVSLNQFAWRKEDDYEEGYILNTVNMDMFSWFGVGEDPTVYGDYLKTWAKEFL